MYYAYDKKIIVLLEVFITYIKLTSTCINYDFGLKITSLKKERDSLVQRLQQEGPTDVQRTRTLQRENAQVCFIFILATVTLVH